MRDYERITSFVRSYIEDAPGELGEIYKKALEEKVPIIRPEAGELLATQLLLRKPKEVLEIGTAVGYSSAFMSEYLPEGASITTLELDEERIRIARENIRRLHKEETITILAGDASDTLKTLAENTYDFVFVDAAKGQYIYYLPELLRVTKRGGVIVSDNVFLDGEVLESHFLVEKRDRTIHDRMREYLYALTHDERLKTAILSVGDGMAVSVVL